MSRLKLYGVPMSRASRTLWMCRELGLDFEHVPIHFADGSAKTAEYLDVNPNGRIPAIVDGDLKLWESMAINLYLARKHGGGLCPRDLEEEALAWQWSFWVMTEVEKPLLTVLLQRLELPADSAEAKFFRERVPRDPEAEAASLALLERPLRVLDGSLAGQDYLVNQRFTVADLNVASVMSWAPRARVDLGPYSNAARWLDRCLSRPAFGAR